MAAKAVKAEIHTRDFKVVGTMHLPPESYHGRLSDKLNKKGVPNFIPVTQAKVWSKQDGKIVAKKPREVECIIVNSQSIEAAIPLEE